MTLKEWNELQCKLIKYYHITDVYRYASLISHLRKLHPHNAEFTARHIIETIQKGGMKWD